MSNSQQPISAIHTSIFEGLISQPRLLAKQNGESSNGEEDYSEELRHQILTKLKNNAVQSITTVGDVLRLSPVALLHILDPYLTYVECNRLIARLQKSCAAQPVSALDVLRRNNPGADTIYSRSKLSTGLPTLDAQLQGGFPVCSVTEIVGRAGVGKTHLSQQLCVLAATHGDGGTIYIDTENKMSVVRLKEIAIERGNKRRRTGIETSERNSAEQVLENVTVHCASTSSDLINKLDMLDKEISQRNAQAETRNRDMNTIPVERSAHTQQQLPVRLLIVDSIAAPLRRDFSSPHTAMERTSAIFEIADRLKRLADDFHLAVIVINQVGGGKSGAEKGERNGAHSMIDDDFTGSLGTVWQHCISTRVTLEHEHDPHRLNQANNLTRRAVITKSVLSRNAEFYFELTQQGVCEVSLDA